MMKPLRCLAVVVGIVALLDTPTAAAELSAGVARVDLTPPLEMGATLGGYGERMSRPATGVHDRIWAKALVVSDGERKYVVVTADVLGFPPPLKPALVERLADAGWTAEQVLLLPSHSHTSIEMNAIHPGNTFGLAPLGIYMPELYELTLDRLEQVVREAAQALEPVSVGTGRLAIEGWNRNRRRTAQYAERDLTLTRVDRLDGRPLAVLVNWTAHPTFMSGEDMEFSAGWPGHLQRTLEALIGEGVSVMYYNGAEGDQSPIARVDSGESHWERAERYGRELAIVCNGLYVEVTSERDVTFEYALQSFAAPPRGWHPDFMQTGGAEYGLSEKLLAELLPRLMPGESTIPVLRLGDLVIVGVPGEMAASLGREIKTYTAGVTGARFPVIGGLANEWISYILPEDEYEAGGYEASVSFYGASLGPTVVAAAKQAVSELTTEAQRAQRKE
ncbi:MAG: neutral/alkaline non-lysosomal ceramidase N-terminal domain-containing protein [Planctomycetales bacterium]|nr:neutral/alkaline non-lysosomal ceramidase N-terminal domain-containing protein [Planctomycetales bacterium]